MSISDVWRTPLSCLLLTCAVCVGCGQVAVAPSGKSAESPAGARAPANLDLADELPRAEADSGTQANETYDATPESPILAVRRRPLSTFSIDTDTASYSNIRRFLRQGQLPPPEAVRIEECLNYFTYDYPVPDGDVPFAVHTEVAGCPWNPAHRLARIGIQGRRIAADRRPSCNLVFLVDVSGSMNHPRKLPLLKESLQLLVKQIGEKDHVSIVVYAGAAGLVLPSISATRQSEIMQALEDLQAGGSTNGALGIRLAYDIAVDSFIKDGVNRVILCTDGDFNVGISDRNELIQLIETKAKSGVFLSCLGFGMGNLKDATLESLADRGNGQYAYIDGRVEAKKVLVDQLSGTLVTIAKDVKIQVEFNPRQISGYRLIGYDNRRLADRDFNDDKKDAGEIGAGHSVTALYELVPVVVNLAEQGSFDPETLKYQPSVKPIIDSDSKRDSIAKEAPVDKELFTIALRYKSPTGDRSQKVEFAVTDHGTTFERATSDFRFASAVAQFGLLLKQSPSRGQASFDSVIETADGARGSDRDGYRAEFYELSRIAAALRRGHPARSSTPAD